MRVPGIRYVQGRNDYTDHDGLKFGIAIHNTSNDASDEGEASYATRRTDGISAHLYADRDSVTQSIDTDDRVGHAGSNIGNNNAIAVEITGSNGMSRAWWLANVAWDELGRALAYIITHDPDYQGFQVRRASVAEMKANPRVKAFYGHNDMRLAWGGTTHTDPGPNFPWDRLFQAVNAHLNPKDDEPEVPDMTPLQAQQLRDAHYTTAVAIPNPTGDGKVPLHVWAAWMTVAVKTLLAKDDVELDAGDLAQVQAAARAGAAAAAAESAESIVAGVLAGLPEGTLSKADVAAALREVLLTGAGPQA